MGMFSRQQPQSAVPAGDASDPLGPSWMPLKDWTSRLVDYRRQGRSDDEIRGIADHLQARGPRKPRTRAQGVTRSQQIGIVTRALFVPDDEETPHLTRDDDGLPVLRLVDSGDRLSVWSPLEGGSLLNPKGTGLRRFGLISTYARGSTHYSTAYAAADLRKGKPVELHREPNNPHDRNAVALHSPGAREPFGYVQKGRAPVIARRMDAGEHLAGVSLHGPGPHNADDSALLLIGSVADLAAILR